MSLNQIVSMLTQMVLRKAVYLAVKKGMALASRRGRGPVPDTAAALTRARAARDTDGRARDAAESTRPPGR